LDLSVCKGTPALADLFLAVLESSSGLILRLAVELRFSIERPGV
jgi:hypothetical protein